MQFLISDDSGADTTIEASDWSEALAEARDWAADGNYDERVMIEVRVEELPCDSADLELVRSDTGDGGWSLHHPDTEELLTSGPAEWSETRSDWDRPNQDDYEAAAAETGGDVQFTEVEAGPLPEAPECDEGREHDWQSPQFLGGCSENPGVWSLGGTAVSVREVCAHCGGYRVTQHNGSQRNPGGLETSVDYEDADETSLAWAARDEAAE